MPCAGRPPGQQLLKDLNKFSLLVRTAPGPMLTQHVLTQRGNIENRPGHAGLFGGLDPILGAALRAPGGPGFVTLLLPNSFNQTLHHTRRALGFHRPLDNLLPRRWSRDTFANVASSLSLV